MVTSKIFWCLLMCFMFLTSYSKYREEPKYFYLRQIIGSGLCLSRGMASVLNVCCLMVIVPMCHSVSACVQMLGAKFSPKWICKWGSLAQNIHIICAYTIVFASVFHSFAHIVNAWNFSRFYNIKLVDLNLAKYREEDPMLLVISTVPGVTGVMMIGVLCILSSSSSKCMRFINYDIFWITHHLFVVFFLLLLCHPLSGILKEQSNTSSHPPVFCANHTISRTLSNCSTKPIFIPQITHTWKWVTAAVLLYAIDIVYRILCGFEPVQIMSVHSFSCSLLSLTLLKQGFAARPGQFIFLQCPNISSVEWHPFSLSKCPTNADPSFTIHIRTKGDWSCRLQHQICREMSRNNIAIDTNNLFFTKASMSKWKTKISIDGPHGSCMENILKHSVSICITGGIGITPFASVLNFLRADSSDSIKLKRLHILWICREVEMFASFSPLMDEVFKKSWENNQPDMFDFQFYLTKYCGISEQKSKLGNTFSFMKPRIFLGRPEFLPLFQCWVKQYKRCKPGIFCCGPKSLNDEIIKIMNRKCIKKHKISFYYELFS